MELTDEIKSIQEYYRVIGEYDGYPAIIYASDIKYIALHFVNWQRNHVWHNSNDIPEIDKNIILVSPNHNVSLALWSGKELISCTLGGGHDVIKPNDKWAYIEDIL